MKIHHILLALLPLAAPLTTRADLAAAERLLRDGKAAEALAELELEPHSPAALYWKGRALMELNRLPQAASLFSEVPPESVFYPYAAKAIVYCAWQSPILDFVEFVAPLTASSNTEIATLAQAALAEHQLRNTTQGDVSTLEPLRKLATQDAALRPMVQLLNIEEMRRSAKYDEALAACRKMEAETDLPLIMRQRVRLAIAEVYYDKAAAGAASTEPLLDDQEDDEGKGEETLLHFISANADSPLLEEAFRRLDAHKAFTTSEYAERKLIEWSEEHTKPHRAALALAIRQRLQSDAGDSELSDVTYANTAATALPNEPVSQLIISEQVRRLINAGNPAEAKLYLNMLNQDSSNPRFLFYKACCLPHDSKEAVALFLKSAETASADLQPPALCNAMFCAVLAGEQNAVDELLTRELPQRARRALLLMHAGLILHKNPAQARAEIESAILLEPTEEEQIEITLQLAELNLETDPAATLKELRNISPTTRQLWTGEQALRNHSLQVQATEKLLATGADIPEPEELLREAIRSTKRKDVRTVLTFNLAQRLSDKSRHLEAQKLLLDVADKAENSEHRARALLLAGRQAERLDTLDQLVKAAKYFKEVTELNTPYKNHAFILRARVLAWIGRGQDALNILNELLRHTQLPPRDKAMALSVLAHVHTLHGTEEGINDALAANAEVFKVENLPRTWYIRAKIQYASLYARCGRHEESLHHYRELYESITTDLDKMTQSDWFVLNFAGAGAVARLFDLQRYAEAADLADQIASWPRKCEKGTRAPGINPRAQHFVRWADNIRTLHFLPAARTLTD